MAYRGPRDINACSQQVSLRTTGSTVLSTVQPETMLGAIGNRKKVWGLCSSYLAFPAGPSSIGRFPFGVPWDHGRMSSTVDDESGFFETGENVCLFLGCFEACRQWRRRKGPFPPPSTFLPMAPCQESLFSLLLCLRFGGLQAIHEEGPFSSFSLFFGRESTVFRRTGQSKFSASWKFRVKETTPEDYYV